MSKHDRKTEHEKLHSGYPANREGAIKSIKKFEKQIAEIRRRQAMALLGLENIH
jgi:hypothetical protein